MRYNHFDMLPINAFRPVGGRMTLEGGGGGGGGDGGAGQREAERQARIRAATDQINRIFNGEVQKTGVRYVRNTSFGMPGKGGGEPEYINEAQYNDLVKQRDAQAAQGPRVVNGPLGFAGLFGEGGAMSSIVDPTAGWRREEYTYWDRDPNAQRQKLYDDQRSAIYDLNTREVNRQAEEAERVNRFGLARNGLIGGSADVDSNAELNRRTNEGLLQAGGIADQAAADLKTQDERTRSSLISMAQQGIDTGSAATLALNGLQVNADNAAAARGGATIGNLFSDLSQAYLVNKMMQGQNTALNGLNQNQFFGSAAPTTTGSKGQTQQLK